MQANHSVLVLQHMEVGMAKVWAVKVFLLKFQADAQLPVS